MDWTYTRESLLNLRNPRYFAILDYSTKFRIKCLNITRKFRSKRGNRSNRQGPKSAGRSWDRNNGVHWKLLRPIPASILSFPFWYSAALLNVRSLSSRLIQIQHFLEVSFLDIVALTETWTRQKQCLEIIEGTLLRMGYNLVVAHSLTKQGGFGIIHRDTLKVRKLDAGMNMTFEYLILELAGRSIISIIYHSQNSSIPPFWKSSQIGYLIY